MVNINEKKITFVIPWYGKEITGGAETLCRRTAENLLNDRINVEVFTTCSKGFLSDWSDFYSEGEYDINGVNVSRFSVDKRDVPLFDSINYKLMNKMKITLDEEHEFMKNNINSSKMFQKIKDEEDRIYLFIPYLYGTTYFGCQIYPNRSLMIPCLHNESYAYMSIFKEVFPNLKGIIFNSHAEKDLAEQIFKKLPPNIVAGVGVDSNFKFDSQKFVNKHGNKNFILYSGRKDATKNVPLLIDYYCNYVKKHGPKLNLVLTGPGDIHIPQEYSHNITNLMLSKQDLYDVYSSALITCQPSQNESFSLSIMESWLCETPVLVHNDCQVTKEHCVASNGGLYFNNYEEFESCIDYFLENPTERQLMAKNGKEYVLENFSWNIIEKKYMSFIQELFVDTVCITFDGHKFNLDANDNKLLEDYRNPENIERTTVNLLKKLLKNNMKVINIGANIGFFTLLIAKLVGSRGRVFAFEPSLGTSELLKKNIRENGYENVEVYRKGVSNKTGEANMWAGVSSVYNYISSNVAKDSRLNKKKVETITIDDFLKNKKTTIDFLMIDAEGSEKYILEGMKETIQNNPNLEIIIEYNPSTLDLTGTSSRSLLNQIKEFGFQTFVINESSQKVELFTTEQILEKFPPPNVVNLYLTKNADKV